MSFKFRTTNRMVFFTALCSFLSLVSLLNAQTVPTGERQALIALYNSTDGANWYYRGNWLGPPGTEDKWHGVTVESGHVTKVQLESNGLNGTVPPEIGNLKQLEVLNLSGYYDTWNMVGKRNEIYDPIPAEIGQLSNLEELNLYNHQLTELPEQFGNLSSLKTAVLSRNPRSCRPGPARTLRRLSHCVP